MADRLHLKLGRFALVGVASTLAYAAFAWAFASLAGAAPLAASTLAYASSASLSYVAHRRITFRSDRAHAEAAPRFALTTLCGFALALLLTIAGERLGFPYAFAVAATCVAVPAFNFLVLDRLVFGAPALPDPRP